MSRQQRIEEHLKSGFSPLYLEVLNESHNHSAGNDTHFKLVVVSADFAGLLWVSLWATCGQSKVVSCGNSLHHCLGSAVGKLSGALVKRS